MQLLKEVIGRMVWRYHLLPEVAPKSGRVEQRMDNIGWRCPVTVGP
jgi:hypothetical protein